MSTILKFKPITDPIKDTTSGEVISTGYQLIIPFSIFEVYGFNTQIKLYCPTCDFLKTPVMLHTWFTKEDGQFVRKETHMPSSEWANIMKFKQSTAMYWPNIDQEVIQSFKYDVFMFVQPIVASDMHELILEIENAI
jgi:hypothetical protein